MRYVLVYDIPDDQMRTRIANICEAFGVRVQDSVFECELREDRLAELLRRLSAELDDPGAANVRMYRICRDCLGASLYLGTITEGPGDAPCLVL